MAYVPAQIELFNTPPAPAAARARGASGAIAAAAPTVRLGDAWLTGLCLTLLGYALFGKGFAYLGVPPLFVGEVVLFAGIATLLLTRGWSRILNLSPVWGLVALAAWGTTRTIPYLREYGLDAPRDAMIWGYGAFAVIVAALLMAEPGRLGVLIERYGRFARVFLIAAPLVWVATRLIQMPRWPGSGVEVVQMKGGDALVHLAGILAFWAAGFGGRVRFRWVALLGGTMVMIGVKDRAGLVTFLAVLALCLVFSPRNAPSWRLIGLVIGGLLLSALTDLRFELYSRNRSVSFNQFITNLVSTVSESGQAGLDGTKAWRLNWWDDIVGYTVRGEHFWTGKGFGINLADDDGYQGSRWDGRIRNPHNGHLTMLARGGVPGLLLWALVHLSWGIGMLTRRAHACASRQTQWAALFQFLLCYWVALLVNASFDVFIEGPMGGVWLWSVYGVGLAAMWGYKYRPELLASHDEPAPPLVGIGGEGDPAAAPAALAAAAAAAPAATNGGVLRR